MESWKLARSGWSQIVLIVVGATIASGAFFVYKSTAQSAGNGFSVSPTRIVVDNDLAKPGASFTLSSVGGLENGIEVTNITGDTVTAEVEVRDFEASDGEDGTPVIQVDQTRQLPTSIRDYIGGIEPFVLEPGQSMTVNPTISIPANATPGSHYGTILFTAQNPETDNDVALSASVGPIVLIEVDGELQNNFQLVEAAAAKTSEDPATPSKTGTFFTGGPLSSVIRLQNNGNTFLQPTGTIQVKNMFGSVVDSYELNSPDNESTQRSFVLPDQIRRYEDELSDKFWFGRYTIEGPVSYIGGNDDISQLSAAFWVIPYWLVLGVIVVVALIVLLPKMIKAYNRRVVNKSFKK